MATTPPVYVYDRDSDDVFACQPAAFEAIHDPAGRKLATIKQLENAGVHRDANRWYRNRSHAATDTTTNDTADAAETEGN